MHRSGTGWGLHLSRGGLPGRVAARFGSTVDRRDRLPRLTVLLCAVTWLPLLILSALTDRLLGPASSGTFLQDPSPHARFLVALPMLLGAGRLIVPLLDETRAVLEAELLPDGHGAEFTRSVSTLARRWDSAVADGVILLLGLAFGVGAAVWHPTFGPGDRLSWMVEPGGGPTPAAWYMYLVSSPVLMVLLWRWVWRLIAWTAFLWRLRRIPWKLHAAHPDRSGGATILAAPVLGFVMVFMVMGVLLSGRLAQDILFGGVTLRSLVPDIAVFLTASLLLLIGPLFLFSGQLVRTRRGDRFAFTRLGADLARDFHARWVTPPSDTERPQLLDQGDSSSVADFGTVFETVRTMRIIPIGLQGLMAMSALLLVPFAPLVFVQFSVVDVVKVLLKMLGLPLPGGIGP